MELTKRPGPRNSKTVILTEFGEKYCREYVIPLYEAENRAVSRMTKEEQNMFLSLLEKRYEFLREEIEALLK